MTPFLYRIARAYLENEPDRVSQYCFVFPNKRSIVFFQQAFAAVSREIGIIVPHPASTTISEFVESWVDTIAAERLEMIMILYRSYREVIYRHGGENRESQEFAEMVDFNKFQRWADIILSDFNDVDMYLVDARQLFPNLERYREISANYLDPEIIEEIKRHWRADKIPDFNDNFWNHIMHPGDGSNSEDDDSEGSARSFFRLWQVMADLYDTFRQKLADQRLHYPGMAYRQAIDCIDKTPAGDFPFSRYIFVGFNMLSTAEEKLFSLMQREVDGYPLADYYFDNASPAFSMPGNTSASFLKKYIRRYPAIYSCIEPIANFPRIEITGVASKVGQAKIAAAIASKLYPSDQPFAPELLRHTAIILPQENLARGVIAGLPEYISPVNLTMGYKLRDSRVATLVRNIVSMHLRSRKVGGVTQTFYYEDVLTVLTHPIIRQTHPDQCSRIVYDITVNRRYNIEAHWLVSRYPELKDIFHYVDDSSSAQQVFGYFTNLFEWILKVISKQSGENGDDNIDISLDIDGVELTGHEQISAVSIIDRLLTEAYLQAIVRLKILAARYLNDNDIYLADTTLFHLLERLVGGETVNFEGRPLKGLQVMGVLEARNLDFENIIIPSMNEKIFPRNHYQKSFIPPHLRAAYNMSTQEHQESIYSYYFYRMISRARRVFLLYDARTQGVGGGQMSRYLSQLIHLYKPAGLSTRILGYSVKSQDQLNLSVRKTPEIMSEIMRYTDDANPRFLSASSINLYINCPLSFYLSYIAGYKREDEFHDYMDESTFGTIIHGIMEDLYGQRATSLPSRRFTRSKIESIINNQVLIEKVITRRINRHYNNLGEDSLAKLKGDAEIFGAIIKKYILLILRRDTEAGEFEYIAGEFGTPLKLSLAGSEETLNINFRYSIDRVDRITDATGQTTVRVIDYKTGSDRTEINRIQDMFVDKPSSVRAKAMLQLFLYCQALEQQSGINDPIQPWIYSVRHVATTPFGPIKISGVTDEGKKRKLIIKDFRDYVTEFNDLMIDTLKDLFNPEKPFEAARDDHACGFCKFVEICRRKGGR